MTQYGHFLYKVVSHTQSKMNLSEIVLDSGIRLAISSLEPTLESGINIKYSPLNKRISLWKI